MVDSMNIRFLGNVIVGVLATPIIFSINSVHAESKLPQPNPSGSVLYGRLSDINDNGAYQAQTPYTDGASRAVGRLLSSTGTCSGSVINTSKRDLVITAAHCVGKLIDGKWEISDQKLKDINDKKIIFTPSFDGTKATSDPARSPLGNWVVKNAYVLPKSAHSYIDVAVLMIQPNAQGKYIQDVTGGYDIHDPISATDRVQASLIGYPGPAPFNGKLQSVCVGDYTYYPTKKNNGEISRVQDQKECWVGGGASGGPYLTQGKTPESPKQVLTVLNSSGGGNVPAVIDELLNQAGATRN